jgi:hypothetical protein
MMRGLGRALSFPLDVVFEGRVWKEFWVAQGDRPDYATRLFSVLQSQGVRCRYQVVGLSGGSFGGAAMNSAASQTFKVLVHRDDLYRARQAMSQMDAGR